MLVAQFSSIQLLSPVQLFLTPWTAAHQSSRLLLLLSCFSRVRLCATPETAAHQAPQSLGFSRQEHCSGLTRLPCPSPIPRAYSNPCPSNPWCHPTISSSVVPFSSCLQSFPASGSFPMSQFFTSGNQSIGVSASASVLPMNIQGWFLLGWTGCISLQSKGLSRVFSNTTVQKHQFFGAQLSL